MKTSRQNQNKRKGVGQAAAPSSNSQDNPSNNQDSLSNNQDNRQTAALRPVTRASDKTYAGAAASGSDAASEPVAPNPTSATALDVLTLEDAVVDASSGGEDRVSSFDNVLDTQYNTPSIAASEPSPMIGGITGPVVSPRLARSDKGPTSSTTFDRYPGGTEPPGNTESPSVGQSALSDKYGWPNGNTSCRHDGLGLGPDHGWGERDPGIGSAPLPPSFNNSRRLPEFTKHDTAHLDDENTPRQASSFHGHRTPSDYSTGSGNVSSTSDSKRTHRLVLFLQSYDPGMEVIRDFDDLAMQMVADVAVKLTSGISRFAVSIPQLNDDDLHNGFNPVVHRRIVSESLAAWLSTAVVCANDVITAEDDMASLAVSIAEELIDNVVAPYFAAEHVRPQDIVMRLDALQDNFETTLRSFIFGIRCHYRDLEKARLEKYKCDDIREGKRVPHAVFDAPAGVAGPSMLRGQRTPSLDTDNADDQETQLERLKAAEYLFQNPQLITGGPKINDPGPHQERCGVDQGPNEFLQEAHVQKSASAASEPAPSAQERSHHFETPSVVKTSASTKQLSDLQKEYGSLNPLPDALLIDEGDQFGPDPRAKNMTDKDRVAYQKMRLDDLANKNYSSIPDQGVRFDQSGRVAFARENDWDYAGTTTLATKDIPRRFPSGAPCVRVPFTKPMGTLPPAKTNDGNGHKETKPSYSGPAVWLGPRKIDEPQTH
ncbi:hypothetical protein DL96DRAFT_1816583 [Flagelloscypha sp. PMI_526]|nr:hypothetical protein DL96DRAFT_1816583 [Flagelloscypha sp. PMI_526]